MAKKSNTDAPEKEQTPAAPATESPKEKAPEKATPTEVIEPVNKVRRITQKEAEKLADESVLTDEERYEERLDSLRGEPYLRDRCNPTYVTEDGMVFHAAQQGEASSWAREKNLKLFVIHYNRK